MQREDTATDSGNDGQTEQDDQIEDSGSDSTHSENPSSSVASSTAEDANIPVQKEIVNTNEGVKVECTSKRGSGTRDQDTVNVRGYYDDHDEAENHVDNLTNLTISHMNELRQMDERGRVNNDSAHLSESSNNQDSEGGETEDQ